jgi:uncharacterized protein (TIGR03083 family)
MSWLTPQRYAAVLDEETARLAAATAAQRPDHQVPNCPEWTSRDLVTHVGTGHRLAAGIIEERRAKPYELVPAPEDPAAWTGWLAAGATRLNDAVRAHGFAEQVWTWQPKHQTAGFWLRRMVHDLIVHRVDAEAGDDLATDLATDGVDDLLLVYATIARKLTGAGETLRFAATDTGDVWQVTLTADGVQPTGATGLPDVTCAAPVATLLLALNRRREFTTVSGDRSLYERWHEGTRF